MDDSSSDDKDGKPPSPKWSIAQDLADKLNQLSSPAISQVRQWLSREPTPNIFEVLSVSINIMETQITDVQLKTDPPDLLIQPKLGHLRFLDFHKADEAIEEGYRETMRQLEEIRKGASQEDSPS